MTTEPDTPRTTDQPVTDLRLRDLANDADPGASRSEVQSIAGELVRLRKRLHVPVKQPRYTHPVLRTVQAVRAGKEVHGRYHALACTVHLYGRAPKALVTDDRVISTHQTMPGARDMAREYAEQQSVPYVRVRDLGKLSSVDTASLWSSTNPNKP